MNAVAETMSQEPQANEKIRARAEHISLESSNDDSLMAPKKRPRRKVRLDYALRNKLRGCATELAILEDHFLSVQLVRPDSEPKKYEFDLRFANPKPVIVRQVAWFWMALALSLTVLSACALWMLWPATPAAWIDPAPLTSVAALIGSSTPFL